VYGWSLLLSRSRFCVLNSCSAEGCEGVFWIEGRDLVDYTSHQIVNCSAGGKPVLYLVNQTVYQLEPSAYSSIILANCQIPDKISGLQLSYGRIELAFTSPTNIVNCSVGGIVLHGLSYSNISQVTLHNGLRYSIWLLNCTHCHITNCSTYSKPTSSDEKPYRTEYGVLVENTTNCIIENCSLLTDYFCLQLCNSHNCLIHSNFLDAKWDSSLRIYHSSNCTIYNNCFRSSKLHTPAYAYNCSNLVLNTTAYTSGPNIVGGFYLGGNFWIRYTGVDTNLDGYGDSPYSVIDNCSGAVFYDYLPLTLLGVKVLEPGNNTVLNTTTVTIRWTYYNTTSFSGFYLCIANATWSSGSIHVGFNTTYRTELEPGNYTISLSAETQDYTMCIHLLLTVQSFAQPILGYEASSVMLTTLLLITVALALIAASLRRSMHRASQATTPS